MHIYQKIYEFAASAGAFEGYVYQKTKSQLDMDALSNWVNNLVDAYHQLPADILGEFQSSCDQTLGRAIRSLTIEFGEKQEVVGNLQKMVKGELPDAADDFQKTKWFQKSAQKVIEPLIKDWIIAGKIVSGAGEGAYFTQVNWVQEQCQEKLGFKPYPGTLNLEISREYLPIIESLDREEGIELISPDPNFCNAKVFQVSLGDISGALILPDAKVRIHAKNIIEIIAPLKIKLSLKAHDGDFISVAIQLPTKNKGR